MGKKNHKSNQKKGPKTILPNVSICTPTFNRRPFLKGLIYCISKQDYPREKMEWIIVDDGTDCIRDIIESDECKESLKGICIRYFYEKEKMDLGKKRNYMHKQCTFKQSEDILVYMDDDDYYFPSYIEHVVDKLTNSENSGLAVLKSSYIFYPSKWLLEISGPWKTGWPGASYAYTKEYAKTHHYDKQATSGEEWWNN